MKVHTGRYAPLVESTRGARQGEPCVESLHIGAVSVVTGPGASAASAGDPSAPVHLRSTAKPFQLLPLLLDGAHTEPLDRKTAFGRRSRESYTIDAADLAVMMASHSGQPAHTGRVRRLLSFAGLSEGDLSCGAHPPVHEGTWHTMIAGGQAPTPIHNNCSGKHTGMLLSCQHNGYPLEGYLDPEHPLQTRIRAIIEAFSGVPAGQMGHGVDGCSAPTFVLPLSGLARMFARLAWPEGAPAVDGARPDEALTTLFEAATGHPALIAGQGRLDTAVMEAFGGGVMAKIGAKGAYAMAVRPCEAWPQGLGVAIKVLDGDASGDVRPVVVYEVLRQLGLFEGQAPEPLEAAVERRVLNHRDLVVGELRPAFALASEGA